MNPAEMKLYVEIVMIRGHKGYVQSQLPEQSRTYLHDKQL
jgi:hypothetical protein